ncbi:MAG: hypothetical protein E7054_07980 [Lentisphaerae bacterium]|nr:hypothetical protein [Lentisphaerota bacterium]
MKPCYIAPDDSSALENASGLLAVYRHACLELLKKFPDLPLILGIDRSLADEGSLARMTADSPQLAQRCRLFRDFPGVENTLRALKKFNGDTDK